MAPTLPNVISDMHKHSPVLNCADDLVFEEWLWRIYPVGDSLWSLKDRNGKWHTVKWEKCLELLEVLRARSLDISDQPNE
jgi:hypothetical protein